VAADTSASAMRLIPQTPVVLSAFHTSRMPDLYPEPDRFIPERWRAFDPTPFRIFSVRHRPAHVPGLLVGA
jgi:cytochrome P450